MYLEYWIENIEVDNHLIMFLYFASNSLNFWLELSSIFVCLSSVLSLLISDCKLRNCSLGSLRNACLAEKANSIKNESCSTRKLGLVFFNYYHQVVSQLKQYPLQLYHYCKIFIILYFLLYKHFKNIKFNQSIM